MRALTISQPWASLIASGEKWVENRKWATPYKGPLAIHAGKGTQYLSRSELAKYPHGAIIATCKIIGCVHVGTLANRISTKKLYDGLSLEKMVSILRHKYTEGPFAFVLDEIKELTAPIPYKGQQGFFSIPDELLIQ